MPTAPPETPVRPEEPEHDLAPAAVPAISNVLQTEMATVGERMSTDLSKKVEAATAQGRGERRTVTVMLADLSGFTAMSELMDPEEVKDTMNECFDLLVDTIHTYEGYVDKFMGLVDWPATERRYAAAVRG